MIYILIINHKLYKMKKLLLSFNFYNLIGHDAQDDDWNRKDKLFVYNFYKVNEGHMEILCIPM